MKKIVQNIFVVLLFSAIAVGAIGAASNQQGSLPKTEDLEPDYAKYIAKKEQKLALARTPREKKLALAEMPDAPLVSVQGKVVMPDGSPLPEDTPAFYVAIHSCDFPFRKRILLGGIVHMDDTAIAIASTTGRTKKDGTFQFDDVAPLGSNVVLNVYAKDLKNNTYGQLLSEPVTFVAHPNMKPLEITLTKGIPVRGKIMYPNGSPAVDRSFDIQQQIEPVLGADIPELQDSFGISRYVHENAEGNYEVYLLPGEYTVHNAQSVQTLKITESDTEKKLDVTLPMPIFVEIKKQDGSLASRIHYHLIDETSLHGSFALKGAFVLLAVENNHRFYVTDEKREQGTYETITPDMVGKTAQFTLKPMSKVMIKLVDTSGNPLVDKNVGLAYYEKKRGGFSSSGGDRVQTDSEGKAVFRVVPGKFAVKIELPGSYEEPITNGIMGFFGMGGTRMVSEIVKELDLAPGETFDAGTVQLTVL